LRASLSSGQGKLMTRYFQRIFIGSILGCMLLSLACKKETEQDKVKQIITEIQQAAEDKDIKKILAGLSKTYRDPQGFTYDTMKGFLLGYFFRHQKIKVYITNLDVTVADAHARAGFQALLSGGEKTESLSTLMQDALGLYVFDVSFKKESGEWKVTSATWSRIGDSAS